MALTDLDQRVATVTFEHDFLVPRAGLPSIGSISDLVLCPSGGVLDGLGRGTGLRLRATAAGRLSNLDG
jgi:hypothetical protein